MLKVVKRPKEYIAIKVPDDCEDVGKFVSEEAEKAGIRLDIATYYADGKRWATKVSVKINEAQTAKRGSIIVCKISQDDSKYPEAVDVMSQKEFDKSFKTVDATTLNACVLPYKIGTSIGKSKQPHVRIDIDNIHDTPRVWIDGERVDDLHGDKKPALSRVYVNWRTDNKFDMQGGKHEFVIQHYEYDGKNVPKEIKTGERSITDRDD